MEPEPRIKPELMIALNNMQSFSKKVAKHIDTYFGYFKCILSSDLTRVTAPTMSGPPSLLRKKSSTTFNVEKEA